MDNLFLIHSSRGSNYGYERPHHAYISRRRGRNGQWRYTYANTGSNRNTGSSTTAKRGNGHVGPGSDGSKRAAHIVTRGYDLNRKNFSPNQYANSLRANPTGQDYGDISMTTYNTDPNYPNGYKPPTLGDGLSGSHSTYLADKLGGNYQLYQTMGQTMSQVNMKANNKEFNDAVDRLLSKHVSSSVNNLANRDRSNDRATGNLREELERRRNS